MHSVNEEDAERDREEEEEEEQALRQSRRTTSKESWRRGVLLGSKIGSLSKNIWMCVDIKM